MARKITQLAVPALFLTILLLPIFAFSVTISPDDSDTISPDDVIPAKSTGIDLWISHSLRAFNERSAELNQGIDASIEPAVIEAENKFRVINVSQDGTGQFKTVTDALKSIPDGNTNRTILMIGPGVYREKITINRTKPFITFYGSPDNMTKLVFDGTALQYGTLNSATVAVESDYFMAINIIFENSAPKPDGKKLGAQAVAMRISGDMAAFYRCKFIGFQDTLCDDRGRHFFRDCYIEGTVDFIFGNGKSLYVNSEIHSVAEGAAYITAQAREEETDDTGYVFIGCVVTGTGDIYLGRAWKKRGRVVFAYTNMDTLVNPEGWSDKGDINSDKTLFYGEYKCMGKGSSTGGRAKYAKILTEEEAKPFVSKTFIHATTWLLPPPKL